VIVNLYLVDTAVIARAYGIAEDAALVDALQPYIQADRGYPSNGGTCFAAAGFMALPGKNRAPRVLEHSQNSMIATRFRGNVGHTACSSDVSVEALGTLVGCCGVSAGTRRHDTSAVPSH